MRLHANWAASWIVALSRLDRLAPVGKEQLLEAMVKTVTHDQQLTIGEAELLRAVCATLALSAAAAGRAVGAALATHARRRSGRLSQSTRSINPRQRQP